MITNADYKDKYVTDNETDDHDYNICSSIEQKGNMMSISPTDDVKVMMMILVSVVIWIQIQNIACLSKVWNKFLECISCECCPCNTKPPPPEMRDQMPRASDQIREIRERLEREQRESREQRLPAEITSRDDNRRGATVQE
jgi:hypothetical protein